MIQTVNVQDLAAVGYELSIAIREQEKQLAALKEAFRQMHSPGSVAYANGVIVEISPATTRVNLKRKPIEDELGIQRLLEIGALIEVPVLPAVRFRK